MTAKEKVEWLLTALDYWHEDNKTLLETEKKEIEKWLDSLYNKGEVKPVYQSYEYDMSNYEGD